MGEVLERLKAKAAEAEKLWMSAEHIIYVNIYIAKEPRLLVRALELLYKSVLCLVSGILNYEKEYKRLVLTGDEEHNINLFFAKCADKYGFDADEQKVLKEVIFYGKMHAKSGLEFSRYERFIIADDELKTYALDTGKIRIYSRIVGNSIDKLKMAGNRLF